MASEVIALHWTTNKGPYPRERRVIPVACNSLFQVRTKWNSCSPLNCCWYCSNLVYATVPSRDNRPHIRVLAVFLLSSSFTPVPWVIDIGTMMYMYPLGIDSPRPWTSVCPVVFFSAMVSICCKGRHHWWRLIAIFICGSKIKLEYSKALQHPSKISVLDSFLRWLAPGSWLGFLHQTWFTSHWVDVKSNQRAVDYPTDMSTTSWTFMHTLSCCSLSWFIGVTAK